MPRRNIALIEPTKHQPPAALFDTRLVAAVQAAAGAQCHRAANLLQAYYVNAEACRDALDMGDEAGAEDARRACAAARAELREFLAERLLGWIAQAPERRLNADHVAGQRAGVLCRN